jgi:transposase
MREARSRLVYEVVRRRGRGEGIRRIARALSVDRKTVRRILSDVEERRAEGDDALSRAQPAARAPRASKLDEHVAFIAELLRDFPDIRATRVLEELKARGFDGSYTIVREYLRQARPKPAKQPFNIVVTPPGRQAQVDWSPYVLADENKTSINCFSFVLSHSRYAFMRFVRDTRQVTLFRLLRAAFEDVGGVPGEIVFDSMPGVVDRWELNAPVLNLAAVDFAAYYGFELHIAPRANGAYKGKVERPFRYLEENFFNGRKLFTLEQARETLSWWLAHRANAREHPRLSGRRVFEVLVEDQQHLKPLPAHPYDDCEVAHRLVDSYGYVGFDGNHYRAQGASIGDWVYVRANDDEVAIIAGTARVLARHPRAERGAGSFVPPPRTERERRRPVNELLDAMSALSATAREFAEVLHDKKRYGAREIARVLELRERYSAEDLMAAIEHAHRYGALEARHVERVLLAKARPRTLEEHVSERVRQHVRDSMRSAPVEQRDLDDYARLLDGSPSQPDAREASHDGEEQSPRDDIDGER